MSTRSPYNGSSKKLVIALDVGTTFSGVSYCVLEPGIIPEIRGVTRFPAQEQVGGDCKIPTILYYDREGAVAAVGAEALKEDIESKVEDEGWVKTEWFKLHFRPSLDPPSANASERLCPLPENKTILDVFSDFLRYLYNCARSYIRETHANGARLWESFDDRIEFVLSHPNGWEGAQQALMRKAAILAGLVPDTLAGRSRVRFVTEGEACLHFCIQSGLTKVALESGEGVLIVDAGGGTVDITSYGRDSTMDVMSFQEIATAECFFQGSVYVTKRARTFLQDLLEHSKFTDDVEHITGCFDKTTKLRFRNVTEPQFIRFGSARDKDPAVGIRSGQLKIQGFEVASFFEPSVTCIIECILNQRKIASKPINHVFLVGGFAASDWLFSQLKDSLEPMGISFSRPDQHLNKAVADGGVSFYIDHFVTSRVSKYSHGIEINKLFDSAKAEHQNRESATYIDVRGRRKVPNGFSVILPRATQVSETTTFRSSYCRVSKDRAQVEKTFSVDILCYRGTGDPQWTDEEPEMFAKLCTVVSPAPPYKKYLKTSSQYYQSSYDVVLNFGLTELTAHIEWTESGVIKTSSASVVYDFDILSD